MRNLAQVVVTITVALFCVLHAHGAESDCVAGLDLDEVVQEALPEGNSQEGWSVGGTWKPDRAPVAIAEQLDKIPEYPSHVVMEFEFPKPISSLEMFRSDLCDALELALKQSCESVARNNRHLACTFTTRAAGRSGAVEVLPDTPELGKWTLIIVADEW